MNNATLKVSQLSFVVQQMSRYRGEARRNSDYTMVVCPFHADKDPSCRVHHSVSRSPGSFRCYGCGAHGKWDDIAPKLHLEPFKPVKPKDEYAVDLKFDLTTDDDAPKPAGELRIVGDLPAGKRWRTFPTDWLREDLGAKLCRMHYKDTNFTTERYVYFPCYVRRKLRGFIRARLRKVEGKPSYLNSPGPWSLRYGFFPYDYAIAMMRSLRCRVIVLVEGPRDALRLLRNGIPAMCILGTQSWSEAKSRILELGGVDTVILFMDGDKAGRKAIKYLRPLLAPMFNVKAIRLPMDDNRWDPGSCPQSMIDSLKRRYHALAKPGHPNR